MVVADQGCPRPGQPWWKVKMFVWEPVLFGTWDGVFTTCMINIFGVVLFLRTGYLVVSKCHEHRFLKSHLNLFLCGLVWALMTGLKLMLLYILCVFDIDLYRIIIFCYNTL